MWISPSILSSIQQLCPLPSKAIKTVISLSHSQAFYISFRERPESSPYLHGYYTVCMRVKTMGLVGWDHGISFLRGHSGRNKDNLAAARRVRDGGGLQDFSVTEPRAARRVIPGNKKRKEDWGEVGMAAPVKGLGLGGGIWGNRGQWLELKLGFLYSCLCTEALGELNRAACRMSCVLLMRRFGQRRERRRECLTEEDMAAWSDRPWEEERDREREALQ